MYIKAKFEIGDIQELEFAKPVYVANRESLEIENRKPEQILFFI